MKGNQIKMKGNKALVVFFLLPLILNAQNKTSFGLNGSVSCVNKNFVNATDFPFQRQNTFGFSIGPTLTLHLSKKIDLCSGVNFRYDKMTVTALILPPLSIDPYKIDVIERFQWIEIPAAINYSLYRNVFIGAGPSLRTLLNANSERILSAPNSTSTGPGEARNITDNRSRQILFFLAYVGFKKVLAKDKMLLIAIGYGSNLTKVVTRDFYFSSALPFMFFNEDYKINHMDLSLKYVFN